MAAPAGTWKTMSGEVLTLRGRFTGFDANGIATYDAITLRDLGSPLPPPVPSAPKLSSLTQPTRTTASLTWTAGSTTGIPVVSKWDVNRRQSADNGVTWSAWADIAGSPFSGTTFSGTDPALPTGTPEIMFQYRVRGNNISGPGPWSTTKSIQWLVTVVQQPLRRTGFSITAKTTTTRGLAWTNPSPDTGVTKLAIVDTDTGSFLVNNLGPSLTTVTLQNLTPGATYDNVAVVAYNGWSGSNSIGLAGWSEPSNLQTFVQPTDDTPVVTSTMMMGVSTQQDAGGITDWDGYRVYSQSRLMDYVPPKRTTKLPKFMAYSKDGPNLGGANPNYSAVYNEVVADLESFYYTASGTHSACWGIQLFWSNGNENYDKGALTTPHTAAKIAAYKVSQSALYDAVHKLNADGSRRYPDAYAGSNPTQNAEKSGLVADWLHPTAEFHDFVMWSHYNPGRQTTLDDPTYNWDTMKDSDAGSLTLGFLTRTYVRTKAAEADAQTRVPGHTLMICTGEVGTGSDPSDTTTRPYYAVHGLAGTMVKLATSHNLNHVFACWWDNDIGNGKDTLSEEPTSTNPSTAEAWKNWTKYNHEFGGTHPASWAGNPKSNWKTTGPVS